MEQIVVGGLLLWGDRVLLVKRATSRAFYPGVWDIAGGHSEDGETAEQTLVRELGEELGIVPIGYRRLAIFPVLGGSPVEKLPLHVYCVTHWSGTPSNLQSHEHSEIAWVPLTEVDKLEMASPDVRALLKSILN